MDCFQLIAIVYCLSCYLAYTLADGKGLDHIVVRKYPASDRMDRIAAQCRGNGNICVTSCVPCHCCKTIGYRILEVPILLICQNIHRVITCCHRIFCKKGIRQILIVPGMVSKIRFTPQEIPICIAGLIALGIPCGINIIVSSIQFYDVPGMVFVITGTSNNTAV